MYENDFCEYAVTKKKEGAYLAKIIICAVLILLVAAVSFVFVIPLFGVVGFLIIILDAVIAWYLSRFAAVEYEYSLSGEYMDFAAIYSKQYRRELLSVELKKSARRAMPYDGKINGYSIAKVYDFRSSSAAEHAYVLVFEENGDGKAVLFDATKKLVDNIFRQIPSMTVRGDGLPE